MSWPSAGAPSASCARSSSRASRSRTTRRSRSGSPRGRFASSPPDEARFPMPFELPPLPYDYAALEPTIDAQTMQIHHDKHHQAYVTNANAALDGTDLADASAEEVVRNLDRVAEAKRTAVRNNAGGHVNHTLFWEIMAPGGSKQPSGA